MQRSVKLDVHGVRCQVTSSEDGFLDFVRDNYHPFITSDDAVAPALQVTFLGTRSGFAPRTDLVDKSGLAYLGSGIYTGKATLYWESPRVCILVERRESQVVLVAVYYERKDQSIRKLVGHKPFVQNAYQLVMRYIVHFPVLTLLRQREGVCIVHAASVETDGRGLIFAGLNGVGKSTIAMFLVLKQGYRSLADNFTLLNAHNIYGFPEVSRFAPKSLDLLGIGTREGRVAFGKKHFSLDRDLIALKARPEVLFIVKQGCDLARRELSLEDATRFLSTSHRFVAEFPEYSYIAFAHFLDEHVLSGNAGENLEAALENLDIFSLTYPVGTALELISEMIKDAAFNP